MITHQRKIRFKSTCKNPLADKLKEKHENSIVKVHSSKVQIKSTNSDKSS